MKIETIAYHEAGHAVVALYLGVRFWEVSIIPNQSWIGEDYDERAGRNQGHVRMVTLSLYCADQAASGGFDADWPAHIRVNLAGYCAQKKWRPGSIREAHWANDKDRADLTLKLYAGGIGFDAAMADTEKLVDELWPAIERVARALLDRDMLTEEEVSEVAGLDIKVGHGLLGRMAEKSLTP